MPDLALNVYHTRVRSYMTDLYAVMYHGAYFGVFDDARIEVFRRIGYTYQWMLEGGWSLVMRHFECDYRAPARMDDLLSITVTIPKLARASLAIRYVCRREDTLLAVGGAQYVFVDAAQKLVRLPEDMREAVAARPELGSPTPRRSLPPGMQAP
jgi:acyl-CoA thioester hydrolase